VKQGVLKLSPIKCQKPRLVINSRLQKAQSLDQSLAMTENKKNNSAKAASKGERDARLAEALRENLRRRKQQARSQKTDPQKD